MTFLCFCAFRQHRYQLLLFHRVFSWVWVQGAPWKIDLVSLSGAKGSLFIASCDKIVSPSGACKGMLTLHYKIWGPCPGGSPPGTQPPACARIACSSMCCPVGTGLRKSPQVGMSVTAVDVSDAVLWL